MCFWFFPLLADVDEYLILDFLLVLFEPYLRECRLSVGCKAQWRYFSSSLLILPLSGVILTTRFLYGQFKVAE